ncbi:MAG: flagellar hook-associated protein FlgK [Lachnospiraceae bacterium]|nr:flagellar hook-associated protein FlgK [Lachnospiraceae bacterium]
MANTFFGLNIGTTGLYAAKTGLNTTAHNVANIETKGYSRQVISQSAATPISTNNRYGMIGSGVNVNEINQMRSEYYDNKYRSNNALYGKYESRSYFMNEVQAYLNEIELEGFTVTFDKMYDSLQELEKDPANLTVRTQVANYAQSMCEYFNSLSTSLNQVQTECNFEIKNQVTRINSLSSQVATLTKQINTVEIGGENANDLRDQRENLIDELSELVNVTTEERTVGTCGATEYIVRLDGNLLVDNYEAKQLTVIPRKEKMSQCDVEGLYDIYWDNGERLNPESTSLAGTLKALFEVRDGNNMENLQGYAEEIDEGATTVTIHSTNINDVKDLNIPQEGKITIGNGEYTYSSFSVSVNADGTYSYTFELNEEARHQYAEDTKVALGTTMDYKGIPYYYAQLNEFIRVFAQDFNTVHSSGENLNKETGVNFFTANSTVEGGKQYNLNNLGVKNGEDVEISEFESDRLVQDTSYYVLTAANFTVSDKIMKDPASIVAASSITDGIGNADVAKKLLALKNDVTMFKQGDPAAFLQTLVGEVGVDTNAAQNFAQSQQNIVQSVTSQRLSVAGVDIDEEAMNLAKYQEAYSLAAKVISVMNETYDTLINNLGI